MTETNELLEPGFRKGWSGSIQIVYPNHYENGKLPEGKYRSSPHRNYRPWLSSIYRAGRYVAMRGDLTVALNATLPKPKKKIQAEGTPE